MAYSNHWGLIAIYSVYNSYLSIEEKKLKVLASPVQVHFSTHCDICQILLKYKDIATPEHKNNISDVSLD